MLFVCDALSIALLCVHTLAYHLGMLDKPREGHDGGPIGMIEGLHKLCELGCRQDGAS